MPLLIIDREGQSKALDYLQEEFPHIVVSAGIGLVARNPYVSLGVGIVHGLYHFTESYRTPEEVVGPPVHPQPPPRRKYPASKRPSESRKAVKAQSAHGFRKTKGVSARGKCPKGHYWSYREKKCVKSKFR